MSTLAQLAADLTHAAAAAKHLGAKLEKSGAVTAELGVHLPGGSGLLGRGAQRHAAGTGASVAATAGAMAVRAADAGVNLVKDSS